ATHRSKNATRGALAVTTDVFTVVAFFTVARETIAAIGAQLTIGGATAVGAHVVDFTIVASFLFLLDAVSTTRPKSAIGRALVVAAQVARSVVTVLTRTNFAISAIGHALAHPGVEAREGQAIGRTGHLALRLEDLHFGDGTGLQTKVGGAGASRCVLVSCAVEPVQEIDGAVSIECEGTFHRDMQSAQVDRESSVDENPQIIVSDKGQRCRHPGAVLKPVGDFRGKVEVALDPAGVCLPATPVHFFRNVSHGEIAA